MFVEQKLEVAAGMGQPMADCAAGHGCVRLLEPRFMEIQQAVGTTAGRSDETIRFFREFVEELWPQPQCRRPILLVGVIGDLWQLPEGADYFTLLLTHNRVRRITWPQPTSTLRIPRSNSWVRALPQVQERKLGGTRRR